MAKQENIELDGTIKQALSNAMFRVELKMDMSCCSYFRKDEKVLY